MPLRYLVAARGHSRNCHQYKGEKVRFQSENKKKKPTPPNTFYPQPSVVSTPQNSFSFIFNLTGSDGNIETVSTRQAQPTSVGPSYLRARLSVA